MLWTEGRITRNSDETAEIYLIKKKRGGQKLISRSSTFAMRSHRTQFLGIKNKLGRTSYHWGVLAGGP